MLNVEWKRLYSKHEHIESVKGIETHRERANEEKKTEMRERVRSYNYKLTFNTFSILFGIFF